MLVVAAEPNRASVMRKHIGHRPFEIARQRVDVLEVRSDVSINGLPAAEHDVILAVPVDVASAARKRDDLVFVSSVNGQDVLLAWEPTRFRRPGGALLRLSKWRTPTLIGVEFAVAAALLGGAVGNIPDFATWISSRGDTRTATGWRLLATVVVLVLGLLILIVAVTSWLLYRRALHTRGTAYLIEEPGEEWDKDSKDRVHAQLQMSFLRVWTVPGSSELLGDDWAWPLDARAIDWEGRLNLLVQSFRAVRYNDDRIVEKNLFVWAHWPVALGFGARIRSGVRGPDLRVGQRPSNARTGNINENGWKRDAHSFSRGDAHWPVEPVLTPRDVQLTLGRSGSNRGLPPLLLLVRMTRSSWGPFASLRGQTPQTSTSPILTIEDRSGGDLNWSGAAQVYEFQRLSRVGPHEWSDYPELAQAAVGWIIEVARLHPGRQLLLGAVVPQEVAVGMGMLAQQQSAGWPENLWPVVFRHSDQEMVIPGLNLGRTSFDR